MKLELIDYTGFGNIQGAKYAENILMFAKNTRLLRSASFASLAAMTNEERKSELDYIARTIPACWEFLHYTILIEDVTRAFTHQLVRTRTASFAQQAMRILPMDGFEYKIPDEIKKDKGSAEMIYNKTMHHIDRTYGELVDFCGIPAEDARGILPTNILTNILMSANLRTFVELVRKRSNPRVQGEYREFIERLQDAIQHVHPFTEEFFNLDWSALNRELEEALADLPTEKRTHIFKLFSKVTEGVV